MIYLYFDPSKHAISKKLGHIGLWLFHTSNAPKLEKLSVLFSFFGGGGHSSHGHDGKFKDCSSVRITMPMGVHDLFCGHLNRLFPWPNFMQGIKFTTSFWRDQNVFELASRKVEH